MPPLPTITGRQLVKALSRIGFQSIRQKGSHIRLKHPDGRITTIPIHSGKTLGKGLLRKILRDTDISVETLLDLL